MQDKRLREQPLRKVKDFSCIVAADVFRSGIATLVRRLARACIRSEPVFFAIEFRDRWHAADFAFAFAYHFYLPFVLSRHSRTALPVSPLTLFFLTEPFSRNGDRGPSQMIGRFDFQLSIIDVTKLSWICFTSPPSCIQAYRSVNCQTLRPCVAA